MARILVLLLLAALAAPAAAAARSFPATGAALSDGERWAAIPQGPRVLIVDDRRRRSHPVTPPRGCALVAIGGGNLLWDCKEETRRAVVQSLTSGVRRELSYGPTGSTIDRYLVAVGRKWVQHETYANHVEGARTFERISTRETVQDPTDSGGDAGDAPYGLGDPRRAIDLDLNGLTRRMCAPLRRPPGNPYGEDISIYPRFGHTLYDGRNAVTLGGKLRLHRCGSRRSAVLDDGRDGPVEDVEPQLGAGVVTWIDAKGVRAFYERGRRTRCLRVRGAGFVHTSRHLYYYARDRVHRTALPASPCPR